MQSCVSFRSFLGRLVVSSVALLTSLAACASSGLDGSGRNTISLRDGWNLHSSAKTNATGESISTAGFDTTDWYGTSIPKTVFAALVENGVYKNPYFGMNLRSIPGVFYKIGSEFSNQEMPADSPYRVPWWYRCEFTVPANFNGQKIWLDFKGINYRANIWLNGKKIADASSRTSLPNVAGTFRRYEFDVTSLVKPGATNALAVEVSAPRAGDLAITFVDWNPMPPDKDMGLWQEVTLSASGTVSVRHPFVETKFDVPSTDVAHLTVSTDLRNTSVQAVRGTLRGQIRGAAAPIPFAQQVELSAGESRSVKITPDAVPALNVRHPKLWWPYQMGEPYLHELALEFVTVDGRVSDRQTIRFGITQATSELTPEQNLLLKVNGRPVLVRGAGWTPDMMLRIDEARREAEFRYVREMGLNTLRLEGKLEDESFMDRADREGILLMAGWCCCDAWEKWGRWNEEQKRISVESLRDQMLRLRAHPSLLVWLNGSDNPPPAEREKAYLDVENQAEWPKPVISSASAKKTDVSGISGVKMSGPYEYVSPNYWLLGTTFGGAFGFNTETSPGPAIPPVETLKTMLPPDKLWPMNEYWDFHSGGGYFKNVGVFARALEARYGKATTVSDFAWKSQAMTYEGERAMFEAYGRNKYKSTGVIQWMLNNAWPGLIWHLYDYDLRPAGGYFGTKKALELVHVQFSYDDRTVAVVNGTQQPQNGMSVQAKLYDLSMKEQFSREAEIDVGADGVATAFSIPEPTDISTTYFLDLRIRSATGALVSRNFYWLSTKPDVLDFNKTEWYYTPLKAYADFTGLDHLPTVDLQAKLQLVDAGADLEGKVEVENPSFSLGYLVRLRLLRTPDGEEILPAFWEDNYLFLLPGEKRNLSVRLRKADAGNSHPVLAIDGFNVTGKTIQ